jgi:D-glycero-D-manno-heptose 1,7-bisphosphate phosphatase
MTDRAVFLDRDGTLMVDVGYPSDPAQVRLLPGVAQALRACREAGCRLAIVSNQSGVGRGYFDAGAVTAVHGRLLEALAGEGVTIDGTEYCLHAPEDGCDCRKPAPTMILRLADRLGVDPRASLMIGDKSSDIEAGRHAGCRTLLLGPAAADDRIPADFRAADWAAALALLPRALAPCAAV